MEEGKEDCPKCGAPPSTDKVVAPPQIPPPPVMPARKKEFPRGAKIGIIAGVGVLILIVGVVLVITFAVVRVLSKPADVANSYVSSLNDGDLEEAWGYLSSQTKDNENKETFEAEKESFKGDIKKWNTRSIEIRDGNAQVKMELEFTDGEKSNWYMYLVKESGNWKLRTISEDPSPGFDSDEESRMEAVRA